MSASRWGAFQERQAVGGMILPLLARCAPRGPRAVLDAPAPRIVPRRRARVSVVIPCFDYGRYLPDAVESAVTQRGVDVEVIIVDDRSTDDSREIAARIAATDSRVRLIVNAENVGHVRSFNAGWEQSTGDYVVKLDADDLLTTDSLSRAVALFEAHPSVMLVYGHPRHFTSAVPPAGRVADPRWTVWSGRAWLAERCRLGTSAITNPEMVLRASLLRRSGAMDPAVAYAPDMEVSLRAAVFGDVGYIGGADQALHRDHAGSMSETDGAGLLSDLVARRAAFTRALTAIPDDRERAELRARAAQALAGDALRSASAAADRGAGRADTADLRGFARDVFPSSQRRPAFRRVARGSRPAGIGKIGALARRLVRRVRQEAYYCRWMVSGV